MNRTLLAFAGLMAAGATAVGVYVAAPGGGEEEAAQEIATATPAESEPTKAPELTPGPGVTLWRWGSITVLVPDFPNAYVNQSYWPPEAHPPSGGLTLWVMVGDLTSDTASTVIFDAETGAVLSENVREEDKAAFAAITPTVKVSTLASGSGPWPLSDEPAPQDRREQFDMISFIRPLPETGLKVQGSIEGPSGGVSIINGRSGIAVGTDEFGNLTVDKEFLLPEDQTVFDRWLAAVKVCEAQC